MSTDSTPTGLPVRPQTNKAPGPQTSSFDPTPRQAGRIRIVLILGLPTVGIQLVLSANALALALGQISYGGCV